MQTLVERLRAHHGSSYMCQDCYGTIMDEAADEIEAVAKNKRHLEEVVGHLGAALLQRAASDDAIIMGHIQSAYDAARKALIVAEQRPHTHAAGTMVGKDIDECAVCGHDIRHEIHTSRAPRSVVEAVMFGTKLGTR